VLNGHSIEPFWRSYTGDVFQCRELSGSSDYFLKRHKFKSAHASEKEYEVLNWLQNRLPVPSVKLFTQDSKYFYLLLEAYPGKPVHLLVRDKSTEEIIRLLVPAMRRMHSVPIYDSPFDETATAKLKRIRYNIDHGYLRSDIYKRNSGRDPETDLLYLKNNIPPEEELVFTHGDYCLPNFLYLNGEITAYLDLGDAGICDRYMDICTFAITLCYNYKRFDRFFHFARLIFKEYGIDQPDWSKLHFYHLINEML